MKKYILSILFLLFAINSFAQRERNYIYILDCSNSMLVNQIGGRTLWDATLDYLQKDIDRQTPTSMINIVPFQGQIYPTTQCLQQDFKWNDFYKKVKDYPKTPIGTNICLAWDTALTMQDHNKDNYLILLTDGQDNYQGVDAVCARIRKWCEQVKNSYGYYVMLSKEAMHPKIVEEVERCKNMYVVDGDKGLKPFGSIEKSDFTYNTLEPKEMEVPLSTAGTFKAHVINDDPNFNVELVNNEIKDGKGVLRVTPKGDLSQMEEVLRLNPKLEGDDINVLNPDLNITVNNVPEHLLTLPTEEKNAGDASWYDSFLFWDASTTDTLTVDLEPEFNQSAIDANSSVQLIVKSIDKEGNVKPLEKTVSLIWNGKDVENGSLVVDPKHEAKLGLVFSQDAEDGKHYFQIQSVPGSAKYLERINDEIPSDYVSTIRADYDVDMNPLKVLLIWLGIAILTALILWFCILQFIFFPRIKIKHLQIECTPVYKSPLIRGCRKVVFTNKKQEQKLLNRIFTGQVKFVRDDIFDSEWYVTPGTKNDRLRAGGVSGYSMNPPGSNLKKMETVNVKSNTTGRVIKVTPC